MTDTPAKPTLTNEEYGEARQLIEEGKRLTAKPGFDQKIITISERLRDLLVCEKCKNGWEVDCAGPTICGMATWETLLDRRVEALSGNRCA